MAFGKEVGIFPVKPLPLRLSFSREGVMRESAEEDSGERVVRVKLLLERERVLREVSFWRPLVAILPDRDRLSRVIWVTRFVDGLHWMNSHEHGESSSSFHDWRFEKGSWRWDLKTIRPSTSSFSWRFGEEFAVMVLSEMSNENKNSSRKCIVMNAFTLSLSLSRKTQ